MSVLLIILGVVVMLSLFAVVCNVSVVMFVFLCVSLFV